MAPGLRGKRDKYEIIYDIMEICKNGTKKTRLMYGANLSYQLQRRYVEELMNKGLIARQEDMYYLTKRGTEFLETLRRYREKKKEFEEVVGRLRSLEI